MFLRRLSCTLFCATMLLGCALIPREGEREEEERERERERAASAVLPFEIVVELTADGASIESRSGTNWQSVAWTCADQAPCTFYLGIDGIAGEASNISAQGFCFEVEKSANGVKLERVRRVNWKSLSYDCAGGQPCRFVVTESGVRGE